MSYLVNCYRRCALYPHESSCIGYIAGSSIRTNYLNETVPLETRALSTGAVNVANSYCKPIVSLHYHDLIFIMTEKLSRVPTDIRYVRRWIFRRRLPSSSNVPYAPVHYCRHNKSVIFEWPLTLIVPFPRDMLCKHIINVFQKHHRRNMGPDE